VVKCCCFYYAPFCHRVLVLSERITLQVRQGTSPVKIVACETVNLFCWNWRQCCVVGDIITFCWPCILTWAARVMPLWKCCRVTRRFADKPVHWQDIWLTGNFDNKTFCWHLPDDCVYRRCCDLVILSANRLVSKLVCQQNVPEVLQGHYTVIIVRSFEWGSKWH